MGFLSKRPTKEEPRRLFFATDLHGSSQAWRKLLNAAKAYKVDALICGGDIAGKRLYPIVEQPGGRYLATVDDRRVELEGEDAVSDAKKRIAVTGGYYMVMKPDEARELESDPAAMERLFANRVRERLSEWVELAEERLADTDVSCYITGGNDDEEEMLAPLLDGSFEHVVAAEGRVVEVLGHPMISLGWSNETPWRTPRETTEERLAELIDESVAQLQSPENAIFNLHVPPKDSTLDTCPQLDTTQDPPAPVMIGGEVLMAGAGSSAVADAIRRYQPLVSLHGHIHEATAVTTIGRTTCINPGSEYHHGALLGAIVVMRTNEIVNYQLTRG
jgi:Icc-related predicted phosphoesterase